MKKKLLFIIVFLGFNHLLNAQTATQPAGNGTQSNPYQIANLENLYWMTQYNSSGTYYIQTADIDASSSSSWNGGAGYEAPYFSNCHYDGNGHTISGLYINRPGEHNLGLFSLVSSGSTVSNLNIIDASITGSYNCGIIAGGTNSSIDGTGPTSVITNCNTSGSVTCEYNGGGIVGSNNYYSLVDQCSSNVQINGTDYLQGGIAGHNNHHSQILNSTISGTVSGTYAIGGIAGSNSDASIINSCMSSANVSGTDYYIGGIAGRNRTGSQILNCGASGEVSGLDDVGGFVGYSVDAVINTSYSTGNVTGTGSVTGGFIGRNRNTVIANSYSFSNVNGGATVGGFVGYNYMGSDISNCYSTGMVSGNSDTGGFAGMENSASAEYSFWDIETSGIATSAEATGKTTAEMKWLCTYVDGTEANWDFMDETTNGTNDFWGLNSNENQGYPFLNWQGYTHIESCTGSVEELSNDIRIYPNPGHEKVFISSKNYKIQQIDVMDLTGKLIQTYQNINQTGLIDLKDKNTGMYILKIRANKGILIKKLIIK